jgi:fatty-acid desaturase
MQNVVEINQVKSNQIQWVTMSVVAAFHILAIGALFTFSWANLVAALITWWIAGSWGIGMGYHRLLTHRGFKTPKAVEYFLTFCGTLGLQSGAINWVTTHRIHHALPKPTKTRTARKRNLLGAYGLDFPRHGAKSGPKRRSGVTRRI